MADDTALADYVKDVVREEAKPMLEPLVERISREYLLVDREQAYKLLSMSRTYFNDYLRDTPQLKLIEHHLPGSRKYYYDPNELKKAVLSLME